MCIILSCRPYVRPNGEELAACWLNNPDGGGFMFPSNGLVEISKGYMTLAEYRTALETAVPIDVPLVLHMRIGTSGGYGAGVTHPFPITKSMEELHALDLSCRVGIAHNGVLDYPADDHKGVSDTISFIRSAVVPIARKPAVMAQGGLASSDAAKKALARKGAGSRFAIMDGEGNVRLVGSGWHPMREGIDASNDSYRDLWGWYRPAGAAEVGDLECASSDPAIARDFMAENSDCWFCTCRPECAGGWPYCLPPCGEPT